MTTTTVHSTGFTERSALITYLLMCGILSSLLYIGMNIFIPMLWGSYDIASQTVSELSAIGAPTRQTWMVGILIYTALIVAFGWGVFISAGGNRALKIVGMLLIIHSIFGLFWPPMHSREVLAAGGGTMTDTLHVAWTLITVPLFILEVGFGATVFGKGFRWYSTLSIVMIIVFGVITGMDAPDMEANLPTPMMGIWERISMAAFMIWVAVFAMKLLKRPFDKLRNRKSSENSWVHSMH